MGLGSKSGRMLVGYSCFMKFFVTCGKGHDFGREMAAYISISKQRILAFFGNFLAVFGLFSFRRNFFVVRIFSKSATTLEFLCLLYFSPTVISQPEAHIPKQ